MLTTLATLINASTITTAYSGNTATTAIKETASTIYPPAASPEFAGIELLISYLSGTSEAGFSFQVHVSPDGGTTYYHDDTYDFAVASPANATTFTKRWLLEVLKHESHIKVMALAATANTGTVTIKARANVPTPFAA